MARSHGQKGESNLGAGLKTLHEGAEFLGISYTKLWRMARANEIESRTIGSRRLVPSSELERIAANGAGKPRQSKSDK